MSIEKVKNYLKEYNMEDRIREFDTSSATVALAAQALGCEPERIAKTMSFDVNGETVLIVMAGDVKIDNPKYKAFFHTKAKMLGFDEVESRIGHKVGGVCPFGVNKGTKVYLEISLKRFETVFPAAGSANSAIEMTIPDLERTSGYIQWIDVAKSMS